MKLRVCDHDGVLRRIRRRAPLPETQHAAAVRSPTRRPHGTIRSSASYHDSPRRPAGTRTEHKVSIPTGAMDRRTPPRSRAWAAMRKRVVRFDTLALWRRPQNPGTLSSSRRTRGGCPARRGGTQRDSGRCEVDQRQNRARGRMARSGGRGPIRRAHIVGGDEAAGVCAANEDFVTGGGRSASKGQALGSGTFAAAEPPRPIDTASSQRRAGPRGSRSGFRKRVHGAECFLRLAFSGGMTLKCRACLVFRSRRVFSILQAAGWPIWFLLVASIISRGADYRTPVSPAPAEDRSRRLAQAWSPSSARGINDQAGPTERVALGRVFRCRPAQRAQLARK